MEVKCIAGADGGLRQHFRLEVYEAVDEADGGDPDRDPDRDPYGWDEDKSNEITGGHMSLEAAHGRAPGSGLGDTGSGSGSGSGAGPPGSGSALGQGELWDASASRRKPVLEVEAGPEPFWTLQTHKLEPGRRYEILLYAVNDKGSSEPAVSLHAVAPPSAEVINGVELRGNMMSRPPLDALASGGGGAPGHQTAPVAVVLGALIACAALILAAVALAVTLVVCRRRREARREAEEARRRDDFREAVRGSQVCVGGRRGQGDVLCQQVVVGSLKRQPVTPGEEDQFGILVTATSPNSSVVGIREGQQQSPPPLQQHTGTLGRPHIPAVGAAAAARSLGTMGPPMGSPMGHQPPMGHHGYPMAHPMPHPAAHPAMMERLRHEDPAGPTPPMAHMAPSMATTIIGSGGGVLNRIRNNNGESSPSGVPGEGLRRGAGPPGRGDARRAVASPPPPHLCRARIPFSRFVNVGGGPAETPHMIKYERVFF
ncbi:hypothetical protein ONE63_009348 [Megalurothrips usitatus]|uniref:Fibronectin type-III domain-containing protein n=1 Tax=Megalurothrips usitatus TaxID=439358 RepID=A0AAV7XNI0_9NEOP|nr:hypothetical protein ONE63_009348 [Megalurothrips usitatus]